MFIAGIDVGGTFTDLTAVDERTGRVVVTKVVSQPRHEAAAVLDGLRALGIASREVRRLVHGTTVGTNAVLERRGARVAVPPEGRLLAGWPLPCGVGNSTPSPSMTKRPIMPASAWLTT